MKAVKAYTIPGDLLQVIINKLSRLSYNEIAPELNKLLAITSEQNKTPPEKEESENAT